MLRGQGSHRLEEVALGIVALLGRRADLVGAGALREAGQAAGEELWSCGHGVLLLFCLFGVMRDRLQKAKAEEKESERVKEEVEIQESSNKRLANRYLSPSVYSATRMPKDVK